MFDIERSGQLVAISGTDPRTGPWTHYAFVPDALPEEMPRLSGPTFLAVADARAALAALDSTARQLPDPRIFRLPALRTEAQSTAALEGTYEPLPAVLTADEESPGSPSMREVLNYVAAAEQAFGWQADGRPLSYGLLCDLQGRLVRGTAADTEWAGRVRGIQVVIGKGASQHITEARFVPHPPGEELERRLRSLVDWSNVDRAATMDPVVAGAMLHYQFETLHPFNDGNGRIGRLLIVMHLHSTGVLLEPTLTVSPWFEARRSDYYDNLLGVSTRGDWDSWVRFFARGLAESATATRGTMLELVKVQAQLKARVRQSSLRAESAQSLVDFAVANLAFSVRDVEQGLGLSYGRSNTLVQSLVELDVLRPLREGTTYRRLFHAPDVLDLLVSRLTR